MFDLTRREVRIFAILLILLGLGYGIKQYRSSHPAADIRVERFDMPVQQGAAGEKVQRPSININTATSDELIKLEGIGQVIASRIIEYRQIHGRFYWVEDIKKVKGISDKIFQRIKDKIAVE